MVLAWAALVCKIPAGMGENPQSYFAGMNRPVVGYNGYTWYHLLPNRFKPPFRRNVDAMAAILAARMAFSNLMIRSRLK